MVTKAPPGLGLGGAVASARRVPPRGRVEAMTERHAWTIVMGCLLATTAAADERAGFAIPPSGLRGRGASCAQDSPSLSRIQELSFRNHQRRYLKSEPDDVQNRTSRLRGHCRTPTLPRRGPINPRSAATAVHLSRLPVRLHKRDCGARQERAHARGARPCFGSRASR